MIKPMQEYQKHLFSLNKSMHIKAIFVRIQFKANYEIVLRLSKATEIYRNSLIKHTK